MNLVFNPPHTWPRPPRGWRPPPGWRPDPAWPPAPPGWQFWVPEPRPVPDAERMPADTTTSVRLPIADLTSPAPVPSDASDAPDPSGAPALSSSVSTQGDDQLVVAAWCDPKRRRFVVDGTRFRAGVLLVHPDMLSFATIDGLEFATALTETATVGWLARTGHTAFDLHTPGQVHRLHLTHPHAAAPELSTHRGGCRRIAEALASEATALLGLAEPTEGEVASITALVRKLSAGSGTSADGHGGAQRVRERLRPLE